MILLDLVPLSLSMDTQCEGYLKWLRRSSLNQKNRVGCCHLLALIRLQLACGVAKRNLHAVKVKMKDCYDRKAVSHTFTSGDRVLLLPLMSEDKLGVKLCGPYSVVKWVGECNYVSSTPDHGQKSRICHVNLKAK